MKEHSCTLCRNVLNGSHIFKTTTTDSDLWNSGHEVSGRRSRLVGVEDRVGHGSDGGHPLHVLTGEMRLALLLPLSQSHVQRLGGHDTTVHLRHGLGGFFRRREADEAEAPTAAAFHHHLNRATTETLERGFTSV